MSTPTPADLVREAMAIRHDLSNHHGNLDTIDTLVRLDDLGRVLERLGEALGEPPDRRGDFW